MAIHDVSKDHPQRETPMPNKHDVPEVNLPNTMPFNHSTGGANLEFGNARLVEIFVQNITAGAGVSGSIVTTTSTSAHNLGYTPLAFVYMNNIVGAGYGQPLPMNVSFGVNTNGSPNVAEYLAPMRYMTYAVDGTYLYALTYSFYPIIQSNYTLTWFLYQQRVQ